VINTHLLRSAALLLPVAMLTTASCSSRKDSETRVSQTADGAVIVDTYATQATVTAIDPATRELTLVAPDGQRTKYKAGPEVANFSQIRVGDQVKAVLSEQVAVAIGSGEGNVATSNGEVALAPVGTKPAGVAVTTDQVTATITNVDARKRKVTYQLPDGTTKTVKADKNVDVSILKPGDNVTVQVSEGLVLSVQKP